MTKQKILIVFGSRFGSTEEISHKIAKILDEKGLIVTLFDLKRKENPSPSVLLEYDGILVGTGIKMGRWTKEVKGFLTSYQDTIQRIQTKGVFISSGWASFASKREQAKNDYLDSILKKLNLEMDLNEAFGGVFDLSKTSKKGFFDKKIIKKVLETELGAEITIRDNFKNDYRDWSRIHNYAYQFAALVQKT